jgi:hypothetical protein
MSDITKVIQQTFPEIEEEVEQALDEALDGGPRTSQIEGFADALEFRLQVYIQERDASTRPEEIAALNQQIAETKKRLRTLKEEMAVTGFVERSVRQTILRGYVDQYEMMRNAGLISADSLATNAVEVDKKSPADTK